MGLNLIQRVPSIHAQRCLFRISVIAVIAAITPLVLSCDGCAIKRQSQSVDTLESVGKEVGVRFPASAKFIGIRRQEGGMDSSFEVKVEIPAADWPGFLASTPIDPKEFGPGGRGLVGGDAGFWDPHQAKNLRTAQADLPDKRVLNIGYDDSRGNLIVVYVVNHGY